MDKRLESIKKNRKCKKLPVNASRQEILENHKIKMAAKAIFRRRMYEHLSGPSYIRANLSVNHKDTELSPIEHERNKVS
jgi:hypothetical protein